MKAFLVVLAALLAIPTWAAEQLPSCTIARMRSSGVLESGNQPVRVDSQGNAFAVRKDLLLGAYHSIAPGATSVTLHVKYGKGEAVAATGVVVAKDFHTDLALIRVVGEEELTPCVFSQTRAENGLKAQIFGFRKENRRLAIYPATVQDNASGNLAVPGYEEALELQVGIPAESLSGSPILAGDTVIGVVNSQTRNIVLAPSAKDVQRAFGQLLRGYLAASGGTGVYELPRNYVYNDRTRRIRFSGLEIREDDQKPILIAEGTPHGKRRPEGPEGGDPDTTLAEGTPHGRKGLPDTVVAEGTPHRRSEDNRSRLYGDNYDSIPVAGMTKNLGYVVAQVLQNGLDRIKIDNPGLASRIADAAATTIAILEIDGTRTRNLLELLRALAKAPASYSITASIPVLTRATGQQGSGSPFEQSIRDANNLVNSLASRIDDAGLAFSLREKMNEFITILSRLDRQWSLSQQMVDSRLIDEAREAWAKMDDAQTDGVLFRASTAVRLTLDERHWRDGIRTRPPVLK